MNQGALSWHIETRDGARIAAPTGKVDESTAVAFGEGLVAEACQAGGVRLVLDLAGIGYMSSRGLRALTLAQRRCGENGATIVLARPNAVMREILAISRYDKVFKVYETVEAALSG